MVEQQDIFVVVVVVFVDWWIDKGERGKGVEGDTSQVSLNGGERDPLI